MYSNPGLSGCHGDGGAVLLNCSLPGLEQKAEREGEPRRKGVKWQGDTKMKKKGEGRRDKERKISGVVNHGVSPLSRDVRKGAETRGEDKSFLLP